MVKRLLLLGLVAFALSAQAQYQVPNSDFESWGNNKNEPNKGWYSFPSAGGDQATSLAILAVKGNTVKLTGDNAHNGTGNSVRLKSSYVGLGSIGANANGNLTTGKINMGATEPNDVSNYNYTARGTTNCCLFTGRPDAIEYWAKFKRGETSGTYNGRCHVILHGDIDYKDPHETSTNEKQYKIAEAKVYATPTTEWTRFCGELSYTGVNSNTSYMLVNFTTNETPGGSTGDQFDIDDIKFIYYSQLKSLTVNGVSVPGFDKDTYYYSFEDYYVDGTTIIEWSDNTFAGVADVSGSYNSETCKYTITVKGQDYSVNTTNSHTYTIQFKTPGPEVVSSKTYTENLYVLLAGQSVGKQVANVNVETLDNGNINFVMKNFMMGTMPVGNIAVENIAVKGDNTFTFDEGIELTAGDDPEVEEEDWFGPYITEDCEGNVPLKMTGKFIGEDHVAVYIFIDIEEYEGYSVEVYLGYDCAVLSVSDAKYGTFAAPVDITLPEGVTAYKVASVDNTGVLELTKAADAGETLAAGTAVVVASESPASAEAYFYTTETSTTTDLLTGVYEPTDITSGYVLQNLDNNVAFYQVSAEDPITVPANRCYLTAPASGVKALVFPDGTMTSISEIQAADEKAVIYDLSGRRVSKATKGIYIINGKKVIK